MDAPRLVSTHTLKCSKSDACATQAIVRAYECGCVRTQILFPSSESNSCMKTFRGLEYTAPGCRDSGGKAFKSLAMGVAKDVAVKLIVAAVTGGAVVSA